MMIHVSCITIFIILWRYMKLAKNVKLFIFYKSKNINRHILCFTSGTSSGSFDLKGIYWAFRSPPPDPPPPHSHSLHLWVIFYRANKDAAGGAKSL